MGEAIYPLLYLVSAAMFVLGIRRLSKVRTAAQGNLLAAGAMLLAVVVTLVDTAAVDWRWIAGGLGVGALVGMVMALRVQMTGMPELVALFNGSGGAASALVALSVFARALEGAPAGEPLDLGPRMVEAAGASAGSALPTAVTSVLSLAIGLITLSGSLMAWAKLSGKLRGNFLQYGWVNALNGLLLLASVAVAFWATIASPTPQLALVAWCVSTFAALLVGVTATGRIGGADMPVVISLLNSLSGVAAAMAGFVVQNSLLIIAGSLVGASGLILTRIMCKGMNRTLAGVLFRNFGGPSKGEDKGYSNIKEASAEELALMLAEAREVVMVPGYGLAVAQAQHATRQLGQMLEQRGARVRYAIHPVAGRMPGHMNVLLAEADVPYEDLVEMDAINPEFKQVDIAVVLGANDVVNPVAAHDESSPIYGMPILEVANARTVVVVKRSLSAGFAGIRNELFDLDNCLMVFGDAKEVLQDTITELKEA